MQTLTKDIPFMITKRKPVVIYAFADTHVGSEDFNETLLKEHIAQCKYEKALWMHLGDWCEAISPKDKRHDVRTPDIDVVAQYDLVEELFMPIKNKGLCILSGNHDETIAKVHGDYVARLGRRLGVPYLGYIGFINLRIWHQADRLKERMQPNYRYSIFAWHGNAGGGLLGSKAINIQRLSHKFEADLYLVGHAHTLLTHSDVIVGLGSTKDGITQLHNRTRQYVSVPSYLQPYRTSSLPSYASTAAMYPQPCGCVRIEINRINDCLVTDVRPVLDIGTGARLYDNSTYDEITANTMVIKNE